MNTRTPWDDALERGLPEEGLLLVVDASTQRLSLLAHGTEQAVYPVSTGARGLGEQENSLMTPRGFHRVREWIGDGEPAGRIFEHRRPTGRTAADNEEPDRDLVVTRILRLEGLEAGLNRGTGIDTYARYIYLHGTNQTAKLGRPASRGCVRLDSPGIIDLFNRTQGHETWCWIGEL